MNAKVTVQQEGGKALMKLRLLCAQLGLDFNKTLVVMVDDYLKRNHVKFTIKSTIAGYKK